MLGMEYMDADDLVLQGLSGETIREAYRREGKEAFARRELEAVSRFIEDHDSFILSLGGGASDNKALMDTLKESGKIIYLTRCEKEMLPVILRHGIPPFRRGFPAEPGPANPPMRQIQRPILYNSHTVPRKP